jgi:carbohydrate binding protein with CBM35 domain
LYGLSLFNNAYAAPETLSNADVAMTAYITSFYPGYHGTGYLAGWNKDGQWVDIPVNVTTTGSYSLTLRFATGAGTAFRYITLNGKAIVNNLTFPYTGSWSAYSTLVAKRVYARFELGCKKLGNKLFKWRKYHA